MTNNCECWGRLQSHMPLKRQWNDNDDQYEFCMGLRRCSCISAKMPLHTMFTLTVTRNTQRTRVHRYLRPRLGVFVNESASNTSDLACRCQLPLGLPEGSVGETCGFHDVADTMPCVEPSKRLCTATRAGEHCCFIAVLLCSLIDASNACSTRACRDMCTSNCRFFLLTR